MRRAATATMEATPDDRKERVVSTEMGPLSFESDIKPLFREHDRRSMAFALDLWSHDDVSDHAEDILDRLRDGTMPCDVAWPQAHLDLFARWLASGKPG
jgi:hypothetical protein